MSVAQRVKKTWAGPKKVSRKISGWTLRKCLFPSMEIASWQRCKARDPWQANLGLVTTRDACLFFFLCPFFATARITQRVIVIGRIVSIDERETVRGAKKVGPPSSNSKVPATLERHSNVAQEF